MKKSSQFITCLLAILLFVLLVIPEVFPQQTYSPGDVNDDGETNIVDVLPVDNFNYSN
ncbi:MAG: hypothetical protein JXJ04_06835 [Spirochaetales bacterium]|nr:hypothetical protein [Spirochaetales bacterium]